MKYKLVVIGVLITSLCFSQVKKKTDNYGADNKEVKKSELQDYSSQLTPETEEAFLERTQWFTDAKFGLFVHFGLYSQLGGEYKGQTSKRYSEWIQADLNIPRDEYAELLKTWNPKKFSAKKIVKAAKSANMKYLVITTKHHEGFTLWPSEYTDFDIENTPMQGRDFIKELSDECKKEGIKFGTYYSLTDWHHESQYVDPNGKDRWERHGNIRMNEGQREVYVTYMKNQIKELVEKYDSDIMWFDGDWVSWWNMDLGIDLYNYIRSLKPSIIINNRCAKRKIFKKDFGTPEQEHHADSKGHLWEACYTMNNSWGFKTGDDHWKSPENIYNQLMEINNNGGNFLLNIGPDGNGDVPKASLEILKEVGKMINEN